MRGFYRNIKHLLCAIFVFCTVAFASNFANAAGGEMYEVAFYCANGKLAKLSDGTNAMFLQILEDPADFDSSQITVPTTCDGKEVLTWKSGADTGLISYDITDSYIYYRFVNENDTTVVLYPDQYSDYATIKVTLNNQNATTAGTTAYYYNYNTYNGSCYYFSNSSLTTCLAGATDGTKITVPTKTGYTFGGYYTKENGGGTQYVNASGVTVNNIYKAVSSDIILYAKWTPICYPLKVVVADGADKQTYHTLYQRADDLYSLYNKDNCEDGSNVNMDAYMGSMPNAKEVPVGFYDVLTNELCVDENLEFTGNCVVGEGSEWFTKYQCKDGYWSYEYDEQFSYPGGSCDPLYYKITLNMNGGNANGAPGQIYEKLNDGWYVDDEDLTQTIDNIGSLPRKDKYVFNGFFTEQNGTGTQVIASDGRIIAPNFLFNSDATIYAYYTKCECTPGDGVSACNIQGTADNACAYWVRCESGYSQGGYVGFNEYAAYGKPGVAEYTATCKKIGVTTGYTCPADSTRYISCYTGKYMATMDASGNYVYNGTPTSGNSCQNCPADAAYCPGGTDAPLYPAYLIDEAKGQYAKIFGNVNAEYYTCEEGDDGYDCTSLERLPEEMIIYDSHPGYTFAGFKDVDVNDELYIDASGNFIKGPSAYVALYAQWIKTTYTITLDDNGGTGGFGYVIEDYDNGWRDTYGNEINYVKIPTRDGYTFTGYYTEQDGGDVVIPSSGELPVSVTFTNNETLYAHWEQCAAGTYEQDGVCVTCPSNSSSEAGASYCTCNNAEYMMIDGVCVASEFTITTTDMAAESTFSFEISAKGTFYVDFDDGRGVQKIDRTNDTTNTTYTSAAYANAGTHTIKMYGDATGYNTSDSTAAISFENNTNIKSVDGSLGSIFGGSAEWMFLSTFSGCTSLQSIPETLFSGVTGSAYSMFELTFNGCTSLQSIPETLFSGVTDSAPFMFLSTFSGCTSLQSIPETLFSGVTGSAYSMFELTFNGCTSLQSIPETLFSGVTGSASLMFRSTFQGCTSLQSIPENLFSGVSRIASQMFAYTFGNCTSLKSLPNGLFKNIEGRPQSGMFDSTFYNCSKLTGYIPANTFEKLDSTDFDSATMSGIFTNTALDTQCPAGMYQYITGFESAWDGKVSCAPCPSNSNSEVGATECTCNTGYNYNGGTTTTTDACVANVYGAELAYECGVFTEGEAPERDECYSNEECYLPTSDACGVYPGHTLTGWKIYLNSGEKVVVPAGENVQSYINADEDTATWLVVAQWEPECYEIKLGYSMGDYTKNYAYYYMKYDSPETLYSSPTCEEGTETELSQDYLGYIDHAEFYSFMYEDNPHCVHFDGEKWTLTGDCSVTGNAEWSALYNCFNGYRANDALVTYGEVCAANKYTVTFNANGGTGSMANQTFTYGEPQNLTANAFTRTGYTFGGWNTAENGGGTAYADKESVKNLTTENGATVTLYAQWTQSLYSCDPGYYWNGTQCVECTESKYYCPGVTDAVYGTEKGKVDCPAITNQYGAFNIGFGAWYWDDRFSEVKDSADACVATYMYSSKHMPGATDDDIAADWDPNSEVNKKGVAFVTCAWNSETQLYTKNCTGSANICNAGYYSTHLYPDDLDNFQVEDIVFSTDTLDDFVDQFCMPVGSGYYSPSAGFDDGVQVFANSVKRYQCPVSTDGRLVESPEGADGASDCYVTCPTSIDIDNGTTTVIDETPNYPSYTCKYNAECDTGYHVNNQGTAAPSCSINTYTVDMYGNGGYIDGYISYVTQERTYNDGVKLTANTFTRGGYTFAGWNTSADGSGTSYADGTTENLTDENGATITLYAQWTQCAAGTYSANGTCVTCPKGSYCANGIKNSCSEGTYADKEGMSECTACPAGNNLYKAALYMVDGNYGATSIDSCMAVSYYMPEYMVGILGFTVDEAKEQYGYDPNADANKRGAMFATCYYDASTQQYTKNCIGQIAMCSGGYYTNVQIDPEGDQPLFETDTLSEILDTYCMPVEPGYWSPELPHTDFENITEEELSLTWGRSACPTGLTTIGYGAGADEAGDCGRVLHVDGEKLYLRSTEKTDVSLHVKVDGVTFFGNMVVGDRKISAGADKTLKIKHNGQIYSVYDDSVN